ncbi:hypothetical protein GCM10023321_48820 [Pseudonocardia eucalypti]|uniref:MCE family protein n=1 Tax=Pseudonocardia eucalypti TaxID=648755 RepID=A0ABP9QJ71_9PSEU|nr:phospholipid/cholesterol/gamma-HCH transport system substrate-binding protein [Pseudonocardia eucalypti]
MAQLAGGLPRLLRVVAVVLVLALAAGLIYVLVGGGTKKGTAYFAEAKSVYPGDAIRILGMEVGAIDKITPEGDKVRVDFHYDGKYSVPANAKAAILAPTLVATRFIQLDPAYSGGPALPDGGVIPVERTVSPVEFDELKAQLAQLADALGPNGANADGALNRALTVIDKNGRPGGVPQGQNFRDMVVELSKAAKTLSDGREDLFGTVRNLAQFSAVLGKMDREILDFQRTLADVTGDLRKSDDTFREIFPAAERAGTLAIGLVGHHGKDLTEAVEKAGHLIRVLSERRDDLAQVLHVGPTTLTDFNNIFHPRDQRLHGHVTLNNPDTFGGPGDGLCALLTQVAAADQKQGQKMCVNYLGPIFQYLKQEAPPVGVSPVEAPRGTTPPYGDLQYDVPNTEPTGPNGTRSDAPRSSTANGNDQKYGAGPGGLIPLPQGGNR